jgi:hypothetical protein
MVTGAELFTRKLRVVGHVTPTQPGQFKGYNNEALHTHDRVHMIHCSTLQNRAKRHEKDQRAHGEPGAKVFLRSPFGGLESTASCETGHPNGASRYVQGDGPGKHKAAVQNQVDEKVMR